MESVQYLKQIPIFAALPESQLRPIHAVTTVRTVRKGQVIFLEGEPGEGFHYVKSGKVKIVKVADDGREHIIKILNPGDLFAEVMLFNNHSYPATAIAVDDSNVGVIRNADLEKLVLNNNLLALQLIKALSQRLLYAQQKIKNLALDDVAARTAETLLRLARDYGRLNSQGVIVINLDLSRQDFASLVGTTRETASRQLSLLKKEGIIDFVGSDILILKPAELHSLL
jgi:CRP/FNR family transcriptional regulator